jgi:competence protein ComEC
MQEENIYKAKVVEDSYYTNFSQIATLNIANLKSNVQVSLNKYPKLLPGQEITVNLNLTKLSSEYDSSYIKFLHSKNIFFEGNGEVLSLEKHNNLILFFSSLKQKVINNIQKKTTEPETSLLIGIITGVDNNFTKDYKTKLEATGTSHIVAVSGFNFMIIFSIIMSLNKIVHRRILLLLSLVGISAYTLFVGLSNLPALRATIMISFIILSDLYGRPKLAFQGIITSLFILLLINPLTKNNVSFQLSFAATTAIVLFNKQLKNLLNKKIPNVIAEIISITLIAFVATSPISIYYFGKQSGIAILANLAISEIIGIATIIGFISILTSAIPIISSIAFGFTEALVKYVNVSIFFFSKASIWQTQNLVLSTLIMLLFFIAIDFITHKKNEK